MKKQARILSPIQLRLTGRPVSLFESWRLQSGEDYLFRLQQNRAALREEWQNPGFRRGLFLSHPDLLPRLDKYLSRPKRNKKVRQAEHSLLAYLGRTTTRQSPFSTLSTTAFTDADGRSLFKEELRQQAWDGRWVEAFFRILPRDEKVFSCLPLCLHPELERSKDHYLLWGAQYDAPGEYSPKRMERHPLVDQLVTWLTEGSRPAGELVRRLLAEGNISSKIARDFLRLMLKVNALTIDLPPAPDLLYQPNLLIEWLRNSGAPRFLADSLHGIRKAQHGWSDSAVLETAPFQEAVQKATALFKKLPEDPEEYPDDSTWSLTEDIVRPASLKKSIERYRHPLQLAALASRAAWAIQDRPAEFLSFCRESPPGLHSMADVFARWVENGQAQFSEKPPYPTPSEGETIPLLEVPATQLEEISGGAYPQYPLATLVQPKANEDIPQLQLQGLTLGMGRLFARFLRAFSAEQLENMRQNCQALVPEGEIWAELQIPGLQAVQQRVPILPHTVGFSALGGHLNKNRIPLHSIQIQTFPDKWPRLIHRPDKRPLRLFYLSPIHQRYGSDLFRFLFLFSEIIPSLSTLVEHLQRGLPYFERDSVRIYPGLRVEGSLWLRSPRWIFPGNALPEPPGSAPGYAWFKKVQTWREKWDLPAQLFWRRSGDEPAQYIDLEIPLFAEQFARIVKKAPLVLEAGAGVHAPASEAWVVEWIWD